MQTKSNLTFILGTVILCALTAPAVQAQSTLVSSGSWQVTDGTEPLNVSWLVVENDTTGVYTYAYVVNNPPGNAALSGMNYLAVDFDATKPGALLTASEPVGGSFVNNGVNGVAWGFAPINPGGNSGLLAFESDMAPVAGEVSLADAPPIGAWPGPPSASVPVPDPPSTVAEPTTLALMAMAAAIGRAVAFLVGRAFRH